MFPQFRNARNWRRRGGKTRRRRRGQFHLPVAVQLLEDRTLLSFETELGGDDKFRETPKAARALVGLASEQEAIGTMIKIRARGNTGLEVMQLRIDDSLAVNFADVAQHEMEYSYVASGLVSVDQIRVAFINDADLPGEAVGRGLIVNNIEADGVVYETESPNVYSVESTLAGDRVIASGYSQQEVF